VTVLALAVCALAGYRIGRLAAIDTITEPVRTRLTLWAYPGRRRRRGREWLHDLITCPWCAGTWATATITPIWLATTGWPGWPEAVIFTLGALGGAALLTSIDDGFSPAP
jgi:hypothetical protein